MTQKNKRDWWLAGTALLSSKGPQGLTIEALCQSIGVTKGSFYHHFKGFNDYKNGLLKFYETEGTLDIIDQLKDLPTAEAKLEGLIDVIVKASTDYLDYPERAIRAWSFHDDSVKEVVARVDEKRLAYLRSLCADILNDNERALVLARLAYSILIGCEQMEPIIHGNEMRALFDEFLKLIYDRPGLRSKNER